MRKGRLIHLRRDISSRDWGDVRCLFRPDIGSRLLDRLLWNIWQGFRSFLRRSLKRLLRVLWIVSHGVSPFTSTNPNLPPMFRLVCLAFRSSHGQQQGSD